MRGVSYLAFAAGYRRVSFVFVEDGQLATWQTSKRAARTPELAASFAQEFIELLVPTVVVMETLGPESRKGDTARALIDAMLSKADQAECRLITLSREKLFRTRYDEAK